MSYVPNTCGVSTISVFTLALLFLPPTLSEDGEDVKYLGEEFY
jgi:hypothetical protein